MRSKQKNISAKAYKILSLVLAFTVLVSGLGVWYSFSGTSNIVEAASNSMPDNITVNSDFFDYYYDNQITGTSSNIDQGTTKQPYGYFNSLISNYAGEAQISNDPATFRLDLNSISSSSVSGTVGFDVYYNSIADENKIIFVYMSDDNNDGIWEATLSQNDVDSIQAKCGSGTFLINFWVESLSTHIQIASGSAVQAFYATGYTYNFERPSGWTGYWLNATQNKKVLHSENTLTMPLYFGQFWIANEDDNTYNATSAASWGLNKFVWGANLAFRTGGTGASGTVDETPQFYAAAMGLIDDSLRKNEDGTYNLVPTQNGASLPYFDKEWLTTTKYEGKDIAKIYEGVSFPFSKKTVSQDTKIADKDVSGEYYVFDSSKASDAVYIDSDNKITETNTAIKDASGDSNSWGVNGFFPLNDPKTTTDPSQLNYGFGARFDIPFNITEKGTVDGTDDGDAVKFAFKGDDDVWIYIDGVLALDLGGAHKQAEGVIDFKEKKVYIRYAAKVDENSNTIKNNDWATLGIQKDIELSFEDLGLDIDTTKDGHTLTMYYMERGMINSNLYVQFNMAVIPNENTLTVENVVNADNVNPGLVSQTYAVADNDVFEYTLANKGTNKDNVDSTGVQYPEYDYIKRYNTQAAGNLLALLSGRQSSTSEVMDTDYIYLDPNSALSGGSWTDANAKFYAWVWKNGSGGDHVKQMEAVSVSGKTLYRVSYNTDEYDRIIFVRVDPANLPTDGDTTYPAGKWNATSTVDVSTLTKNRYQITDWNGGTWSNTLVMKTITDKVTSDNKYLETITDTIDTNTFYPVAITNYALTDPFAQIKGTDDNWSTYSGTIAGQTDDSGKLNLMYNETAKFTGQFKKGSTMQVVQADTLKTPTVRSESELVEFDSSDRTVSQYYTTTVTLTGSSDAVPDSNNQFAYNNTSDEKVRITETFTNTVKTGDLTIIKNVEKGDTSTAGTFTFQVTLNNLFGSDTSVSDYSEITYKLYENKESSSYTENKLSTNGTFTMGPNQKVVIEGIPVGTTYTVEETTVGSNYNKVGGVTYANTNKTITIDADDTVTVTNERKLGSLTLNKDVKDSNGTDNVTNDDKNTKFEFTVTLTAPTGVDLSKYDIVVLGGTVSSDKKTITVDVSENSPVTITGIPYGTGYTVTETNIPSDWTKLTETAPNGTISSDTQTATIVNKKNIVLTTEAYLTITKYIDSLYYNSSDNPHGFADGYSIISGNDTTNDAHGYLKYTNAEQAFTFEVKEYDGDTLIGTYQVLLNFPADSTRLETAVNGSYYYVQSKTFKVTAGHKYEITETNTDNGLSWRYDFALAEGSGNLTPTINGQTVSFTYAESAETAQEATATFYDKRNTTSNTIESDMSSITNNITKAAL